MEKFWKGQFGTTYYSFKYKNALFIILDTEYAPPGKIEGKIGKQQLEEKVH